MRDAPLINALWSAGGPFTGEDGKPHTRVTVQRPWSTSDPDVKNGDEDHVIHPTWINGVGSRRERGVPIRWYQRLDNSQTEDEVPNVKTVTIDRSVETDVATCSITLYNQWVYEYGTVPADVADQGNRHLSGYFTPTRGVYPEAQVRWSHGANEWEDTFVPNAIIRTYQGYGGHSKTLQECIDDGNLLLTGIWLVDEVQINTSGELQLRCRDMAKLLVDQQLYLPLVPTNKYPLTYYRWVYENFQIRAAAKRVTTTTTTRIPAGNKRCVFRTSSVDAWYPGDTATGGHLLHGHKGSHSLDGNTLTYWLGEGNSGPDKVFATSYIEYDCGEHMDTVYLHPWGGNYEVYISVMEGGRWQGSSYVPYDHSPLVGNQPHVVNTGAYIPYVKKVGIPWETAKSFVLPRVYRADRVRVSFRHLTYSGIGPWMYRAGVREFRIRASTSAGSTTTKKTITVTPIFLASAGFRDPNNLNALGYLTVSDLGQDDAFGDLRRRQRAPSPNAGDDPSNARVYWTALHSTGVGYWVLRSDGRVTCYGSVGFYGSPHADGVGLTGGDDSLLSITTPGYWAAICPTPSNLGYWCVAVDGRIREYGDATAYADVSPGGYIAGAMPLVSGSHGLFIADTDGTVHVRGSATHYGDWTETTLVTDEKLASVTPNMDGTGYWLMTNSGRVQAKGAVTDYGQDANPAIRDVHELYDQLIPIPSDDGYLLMRADGHIFPFGNAQFFGSPIPGSTGQIRKDGNYRDYSDIIKDLALWSGFLLFDPDLQPNEEPAVYGNIESTGAWAEEQLPDEIFDKRPVIDAMQQIKEVVGYLLFVDDQGGFRFESPNYWQPGNFIQETGEHVSELLEIDEQVNLLNLGISWDDESLRSMIVISSEDPDEFGSSTVTTRIAPQTSIGLRGLLKPAMWVNGWFQSEDEQKIMAELIAMHIWFAQRIGQVECIANPAIQINDQVRVYERQTGDVFIHYVRGVNTTHDLDSGRYSMTLTTHWLGTGEEWAITDSPEYAEDIRYFVLSPGMRRWLEERGIRQEGQDDLPSRLITFFDNDPEGPGGPSDDGAAT